MYIEKLNWVVPSVTGQLHTAMSPTIKPTCRSTSDDAVCDIHFFFSC